MGEGFRKQSIVIQNLLHCHETSRLCVCVYMCTWVPVNGPGGYVVRDVSGVCAPVPVRQLFDLQGEVPQRGGARATRHPVEVKAARFNSVLRRRQLPGWLGTLCG